jgi:hypothetical protein
MDAGLVLVLLAIVGVSLALGHGICVKMGWA